MSGNGNSMAFAYLKNKGGSGYMVHYNGKELGPYLFVKNIKLNHSGNSIIFSFQDMDGKIYLFHDKKKYYITNSFYKIGKNGITGNGLMACVIHGSKDEKFFIINGLSYGPYKVVDFISKEESLVVCFADNKKIHIVEFTTK
jgi:hypothetical protein